MKIYKLQVDDALRPDHQDYLWPPANQRSGWDFGVEQDFEWWLDKQDLLTSDIDDADWLYLPIFWNRYFIDTPDSSGAWGGGVELLEDAVHDALSYQAPIFTICEADEKVLRPTVDFGDMVMFIASRRVDNSGIDIPLLSGLHNFPDELPDKKYLASFVGNLGTDSVRIAMREKLRYRIDCCIEHGEFGEDYFVNLMLESYIALCPRGQGAQSFRMYEAMQLGTVPLYISDMDCRPFRNWIDWDICSFWINSADRINEYIGNLGRYQGKLAHMGHLAKITFDDFLGYGKWCKFVLRELELL